MPKIRVFADTNVILEAFRTGCWTAISSHFAIETVQKCIEETLTGNPGDPRHVSVPPADLNAGLAEQHSVTRKELASLTLAHHSCSTLDDGEKHLLAWLETAPPQFDPLGKPSWLPGSISSRTRGRRLRPKKHCADGAHNESTYSTKAR
jgi:hypothetical protein